MSILISDTSAWIKKIPSEQLQDADFVRIVNFFVFHSPCKGLSAMGVSLAEYGWSNPWKSPFYLNKQLRQAATNYELLFSAQNRTSKKNQSAVENKEAKKDMMEMALEKSGLKDHFPHSFEKEVICFRNNKNNQFISAFYHIRNALAHGRFCIQNVNGEDFFAFEDVGKNKVSARMILRKSTLLQWIELIEGGEKPYQRAQ